VAASTISGFHDISAGQLKARARGGLMCALFGSAWMYWAVVFSGHRTPTWFSTVTLPAMPLTAWAILRIRAFRHLISSPADLKHWKAFRKFLWIDSAIEWDMATAVLRAFRIRARVIRKQWDLRATAGLAIV